MVFFKSRLYPSSGRQVLLCGETRVLSLHCKAVTQLTLRCCIPLKHEAAARRGSASSWGVGAVRLVRCGGVAAPSTPTPPPPPAFTKTIHAQISWILWRKTPDQRGSARTPAGWSRHAPPAPLKKSHHADRRDTHGGCDNHGVMIRKLCHCRLSSNRRLNASEISRW
ncbi:hypothetical protein OJAV_G00078370 [Oryzias javanicus]|uniref:Uncharacterized protein n=1 Tax=Oryzias javanicus TaxID=123683 RepID=A0A437D4A2_ORYJA|nr:hypothetical protein OJAV_G00078370 [Oryzias javanicus]